MIIERSRGLLLANVLVQQVLAPQGDLQVIGIVLPGDARNLVYRGEARIMMGKMDDARIYNRALTFAEMAGMAGRTDPFYPPY